MKFMKRKKNASSVTEHDVKKHVIDILGDTEEEDEHINECAKVVKMSIIGKKIPKNIIFLPLDNLSLYYEESIVKWKFFYPLRLTP